MLCVYPETCLGLPVPSNDRIDALTPPGPLRILYQGYLVVIKGQRKNFRRVCDLDPEMTSGCQTKYPWIFFTPDVDGNIDLEKRLDELVADLEEAEQLSKEKVAALVNHRVKMHVI